MLAKLPRRHRTTAASTVFDLSSVGGLLSGGYPAAVDYPDKSSVCPHCHRAAAFDLVHRVQLSPSFSAVPSPSDDADETKHHWDEICLVVFKCQGRGCGRSSAFHEYRFRVPNEDAGGQSQIKHWFVPSYPPRSPRRLPGEGVPEAVRSFYTEGGIAEAAGAPRAAAAMFRGAVEAICDALDIPRTGKTDAGKEYQRKLQVRVDDLASKGLDREVVSDMHEARVVGNDSVHDGLIYSADELADIADLIAEAVQLAFVQPAERQAMRDKRRERRETHRAQN